MAEERIIDDEYGRGVKLRKTKDGYVDVTDEQLDNPPATDGETQEEEELTFAFPTQEQEEDDEDLVGLSPEDAEELRKQKAEAVRRRREEYEEIVAEGNALLEQNSFHSAELKFEKALQLDEPATEASVGYWRAKTENFTKPEVLIDEYVEPGIESLEYDLGYEATDIIKKEYREVFEKKYAELEAEEAPLAETVEGKQAKRRKILKARRRNAIIAFAVSAIPMLVCIVLTALFGLKNFSTPDGKYIPLTIGFGAASFVLFIVFAVFTNRLINAFRMYKKNETLTSTEDGERLFEIRERKELYGALKEVVVYEEVVDEAEPTEEKSEE